MGQRKQKKKKAGKGGGGREPQRQPEPEPEPEPEPAASAENAEGDSEAARQARLEKMEPAGQGDEGRQHFRVINRAFVRSDFEMNSVREGTVEVGEEIEALEMRQNENGVVRVRFERGWVSADGPDGSTILERIGAGSARQREARETLLTGKRGAAESVSQPAPATDEEQQPVYRVLNRAFVRAGFELDSRREGTVEPGEEIVALELRDNRDGVTRVRFERGWVSATGPDGTAVLVDVGAEQPPQRQLLETALTEGLLDTDGRPKPLPAAAARAPLASQYVLHDDDGPPLSLDGSFQPDSKQGERPPRGTWPTIPTFDGSGGGGAGAPPHEELWGELLGKGGLASLGEAPRVSAAELEPDSVDPAAVRTPSPPPTPPPALAACADPSRF